METTVTSARGWSPDVTVIPAEEAVPDALILRASTVSGRVEGDAPSVRVIYVDGADADFVPEGSLIPEADPTLAETVIATGRVSILVPVSLEQWSQVGRDQILADSVRAAVIRRADQAFVAEPAPTAPATTPPAGLINAGVPAITGAVTDNLDPVADAVAAIEAAGGTATHILAAPDAWAALRKVKTEAGSAASLLGAGTEDAVSRLFGIEVIRTPAVPAGQLLLLDRSAVVSAVGDVLVAKSEHYYFRNNAMALRCTFRFGQALMRPDRTALVTVTPPGETAGA